jgi:hypothetical protein
MPRRQVINAFLTSFSQAPFELNENTAFALCSAPLESVAHRFKCRRSISKALAEATFYNGRPILPLWKLFGVSPTAMAIRLEELGLV